MMRELGKPYYVLLVVLVIFVILSVTVDLPNIRVHRKLDRIEEKIDFLLALNGKGQGMTENGKRIRLLHLSPFDPLNRENINRYSPYHYGAVEKGFSPVMDVKKLDTYILRWGALRETLEAEMRQFDPHIVFVTDKSLNRTVLRQLKEGNRDTFFVFFFYDNPGFIDYNIVEYGKICDLLLVQCDDERYLKIYGENVNDIKPFYQSIDMDLYYPVHNNLEQCEWDVVFLGSNKAGFDPKVGKPWHFAWYNLFRQELIKKINRCKDIKMMVAGRGWERCGLKNWREEAFGVEANLLMSNARMSVGVQIVPDTRGSFSLRFLMHLASGRLHLTSGFEGIESWFIPNRHLVTFESAEDCIRKIRHYKKHPQRADRIGMAGREVVLENHSGYHRGLQLLGYYLDWAKRQEVESE